MPSPKTPPVARQVGADWTHRDGEGTTLTISVCRACSGRWFPPRDTCSTCASTDVEDIASDSRGRVYASSVVRIAPRGFQAPYVLTYVDISGVRLLAHSPGSDRALVPGSPVELTVAPIADTGDGPVMSYVVTPLDDQHAPTGEQ
ncbi:Zn-ribbon domain-containing OB-fold protein [Streptomyces sp. NPDC052016]|uniref:Zn-ribbon domain-containing OB-fold protein n=1 Tax=Streptomyces sp. NPDC052016 TaxID=3365680 RepID=UPI0037D42C6B